MRDPTHLDVVRAMPCCYCSAPGPSDPHHFGPRGTGIKASDLYVVPLCRTHHDEFHARRRVGVLNERETMALFWKDCARILAHRIETSHDE